MFRRHFAPWAIGALVILATACAPSGPANQSPLAIFNTSVSSGSAPLVVSFNAGAAADPDGTIVSHSWDFGDFTTGSGVVTSHSFGPGTYVVRLTVTDNLGATGVSASVISVSGTPTAPTGLQKIGSGCCDTYGIFSWNPVAGVEEYQISMDGYLGCLTDHSATIPAPASTGQVTAFGLCLGSRYHVAIRARFGPNWSAWSPSIDITL